MFHSDKSQTFTKTELYTEGSDPLCTNERSK